MTLPPSIEDLVRRRPFVSAWLLFVIGAYMPFALTVLLFRAA